MPSQKSIIIKINIIKIYTRNRSSIKYIHLGHFYIGNKINSKSQLHNTFL